ncbi:hypothetical protein F5Y11DRAFT_310776 [Daldinia sp. FL1419]|nr:hypothetical protein F5Y11DRAFT_310776 [Daldinia sp. FL1419]
MVQSRKPGLILVDATTSSEHNFLVSTGANIIDVSILNQPNANSQQLVPNQATPSDRAIISYTSGSTGVPKGVPPSHSSYRNHVEIWVLVIRNASERWDAATLFHLIDVYGPTDVTFGCADNLVPLGSRAADGNQEAWERQQFGLFTLPNYAIYIHDTETRPVPVGTPGRVAVDGAGVSGGYLSETKLTAAAFLHDQYSGPFMNQRGWTVIHLTEDRGRIDSQGRLHLEDRVRKSTLVKLGGIRVDL